MDRGDIVGPTAAGCQSDCTIAGGAAGRGPAGCQEVVWLVGSSSRGNAPVDVPGPPPGSVGIPVPLVVPLGWPPAAGLDGCGAICRCD